jgi:VWFA-related protein
MTILRVLLLLCATGIAAAGQEQTRRVYVSALDSNGTPVADLTAADFTIKDGGKTRGILRAEPALAKMQIAILVDDNGTGLFRVSVARFIEALLGRAEFSISTVTGQMLRLVDYTTDNRELSEAVLKLGARPATNDGGQLLDGITQTSTEMARRGAGRPIIVALTVGGEDVTPISPHDALDQLRQSGAALHVVSVLNSAMRAVAPPSKPSDLLNENLGLHEVLGDGPKRSGGHREEIAAIAGVTTGLQKLAEQLKRQYVIEYSLDGAKPSGRLNVSVKRKGVTVRAPTHVPDKM